MVEMVSADYICLTNHEYVKITGRPAAGLPGAEGAGR